MKKSLFLVLPFFLFGAVSCTTEAPPVVDTDDTDDEKNDVVEETKPSIVDAVKEVLDGFNASGSLSRDLYYQNQYYQANNQVVNYDASYTFAEDAFQSKLTREATLDETFDPVFTTYFKDEKGLLCEEYLKADNTVGLMPLRDTYGYAKVYSSNVINPFVFLKDETSFTKIDDNTFEVTGEVAGEFIYYLTSENTSSGTVTFTISDDSKLTSFTIASAIEDSFLISSGTYTPRTITVTGEFTVKTTDLTIENRLTAEPEKSQNEALQTFLDSLDKRNVKLTTYLDKEDPMGASTIPYYFKDNMILMPFASMGLTDTPADFDMVLVENEEKLMDLYFYMEGEWVINDPEMMEMYYNKVPYETIAPLLNGINANIFDYDEETFTYVAKESAVKTLGQYFVPRFTDNINLIAMDDLCYSCVNVEMTLETKYATVWIDSNYSNGGLSVTGSTGFIIEQDGTFPYEVTIA